MFVRLSNTLRQFGIHLKKTGKYLRLSKYKGKQLGTSLMTGAVTNIIDTLQWDTLACRRTKANLILLFKLSGGLVDVPTTMLSQSDRRTRGAHKFRQIQLVSLARIFIYII